MNADPTKIQHPTVELKISISFETPLPENFDEILETTMRVALTEAIRPLLESDLAPIRETYCDYDVWDCEEEG